MSVQELELHLEKALKKLEKSSDKILSTRGYTTEVEKIRLLEEMIKEQLANENTFGSTSKTR